MGILLESILDTPQIQEPHCQLFIGLTDPEDVATLINGAVTDTVDETIDSVQFGVKVSGYFAGDHSDLALLGPGHKLIRISHNKKYFNELSRPPGRSRRGAIRPGSGPSSGCLFTKML